MNGMPQTCNGAQPVVWHTVCGVAVGILHRQADAHAVGREMDPGRQQYYLVHDPENKARYLISTAGGAALVDDTVGKRDYGTKTKSFLCMLFQKGGCRARNACNQLHVDPELVSVVRKIAEDVTDVASQAGSYTVRKRDNFVAELSVYDPVNEETVAIAYHLTRATVGRSRAVRGDPGVSLCTYHLTRGGGCKFGSTCRDVHVKDVYSKGRQASCCPAHSGCGGAAAVPPGPCISVTGVKGASSAVPVPRRLVSLTRGCARYLAREFPTAKVCLPHQKMRCPHGELCNNVHVCRVWYAEALPAAAATPRRRGGEAATSGGPDRLGWHSDGARVSCVAPASASTSNGASSLPDSRTGSVGGGMDDDEDEDEDEAFPSPFDFVLALETANARSVTLKRSSPTARGQQPATPASAQSQPASGGHFAARLAQSFASSFGPVGSAAGGSPAAGWQSNGLSSPSLTLSSVASRDVPFLQSHANALDAASFRAPPSSSPAGLTDNDDNDDHFDLTDLPELVDELLEE
ncbi:hypothetical protein DIPPA_28666 [Diplonema papillatum]|nr:hypothetical protein DIPPA_28666 [Diplonema papillatum]